MSDKKANPPGPYFTNSGKFAERYHGNPGTIGVIAEQGFTRIGTAFRMGRDSHGRAVFRLVIDMVDVPGRWVGEGGRFLPSGE